MVLRRENRFNGFEIGEDAGFPMLSPDDIIVPILGMTGAGKSSFIALCTQQEDVTIGHTLSSCTSGVSIYTVHHKGRVYRLVDTPGFDDSGRNDCETLQELAFWLGAAYEEGVQLNGIIYLHRITDLRVQGAALQSLQVLKALCGRKNYSNLYMATTRWEQVGRNQKSKAIARQRELCKNERFWGDIQSAGGRVISLSNNRDDALKLLEEIAERNSKFNLAFQQQFVDQRRQIYQTDAGRIVYEAIQGKLDEDAEAMEEEAKKTIREELFGLASEQIEALESFRLQIEEIMQPRQRELDKLRINAERLQKIRLEQLEHEFQVFQEKLSARLDIDGSSIASSSASSAGTETESQYTMQSDQTAYSGSTVTSKRGKKRSDRHSRETQRVGEELEIVVERQGGGGMKTMTALSTALGAVQVLAAVGACNVM